MPNISQLSEEQQALLLIEAMRKRDAETLAQCEKAGIRPTPFLSQALEKYDSVRKTVFNETVFAIVDNEGLAGHVYMAFPDEKGEIKVRGFYPEGHGFVRPGDVRDEFKTGGRLSGAFGSPPGELPPSARAKAIPISQEGLKDLRTFIAKKEIKKGTERENWVLVNDNCIGFVHDSLQAGGIAGGLYDQYSPLHLAGIMKPVSIELKTGYDPQFKYAPTVGAPPNPVERYHVPKMYIEEQALLQRKTYENAIQKLEKVSKEAPAIAAVPATSHPIPSERSLKLLIALQDSDLLKSITPPAKAAPLGPPAAQASGKLSVTPVLQPTVDDKATRRTQAILNQFHPSISEKPVASRSTGEGPVDKALREYHESLDKALKEGRASNKSQTAAVPEKVQAATQPPATAPAKVVSKPKVEGPVDKALREYHESLDKALKEGRASLNKPQPPAVPDKAQAATQPPATAPAKVVSKPKAESPVDKALREYHETLNKNLKEGRASLHKPQPPAVPDKAQVRTQPPASVPAKVATPNPPSTPKVLPPTVAPAPKKEEHKPKKEAPQASHQVKVVIPSSVAKPSPTPPPKPAQSPAPRPNPTPPRVSAPMPRSAPVVRVTPRPAPPRPAPITRSGGARGRSRF